MSKFETIIKNAREDELRAILNLITEERTVEIIASEINKTGSVPDHIIDELIYRVVFAAAESKQGDSFNAIEWLDYWFNENVDSNTNTNLSNTGVFFKASKTNLNNLHDYIENYNSTFIDKPNEEDKERKNDALKLVIDYKNSKDPNNINYLDDWAKVQEFFNKYTAHMTVEGIFKNLPRVDPYGLGHSELSQKEQESKDEVQKSNEKNIDTIILEKKKEINQKILDLIQQIQSEEIYKLDDVHMGSVPIFGSDALTSSHIIIGLETLLEDAQTNMQLYEKSMRANESEAVVAEETLKETQASLRKEQGEEHKLNTEYIQLQTEYDRLSKIIEDNQQVTENINSANQEIIRLQALPARTPEEEKSLQEYYVYVSSTEVNNKNSVNTEEIIKERRGIQGQIDLGDYNLKILNSRNKIKKLKTAIDTAKESLYNQPNWAGWKFYKKTSKSFENVLRNANKKLEQYKSVYKRLDDITSGVIGKESIQAIIKEINLLLLTPAQQIETDPVKKDKFMFNKLQLPAEIDQSMHITSEEDLANIVEEFASRFNSTDVNKPSYEEKQADVIEVTKEIGNLMKGEYVSIASGYKECFDSIKKELLLLKESTSKVSEYNLNTNLESFNSIKQSYGNKIEATQDLQEQLNNLNNFDKNSLNNLSSEYTDSNFQGVINSISLALSNLSTYISALQKEGASESERALNELAKNNINENTIAETLSEIQGSLETGNTRSLDNLLKNLEKTDLSQIIVPRLSIKNNKDVTDFLILPLKSCLAKIKNSNIKQLKNNYVNTNSIVMAVENILKSGFPDIDKLKKMFVDYKKIPEFQFLQGIDDVKKYEEVINKNLAIQDSGSRDKIISGILGSLTNFLEVMNQANKNTSKNKESMNLKLFGNVGELKNVYDQMNSTQKTLGAMSGNLDYLNEALKGQDPANIQVRKDGNYIQMLNSEYYTERITEITKRKEEKEKVLAELQQKAEIIQAELSEKKPVSNFVNNFLYSQIHKVVRAFGEGTDSQHHDFMDTRTWQDVAKGIGAESVGKVAPSETTPAETTPADIKFSDQNWYSRLNVWLGLLRQCKGNIEKISEDDSSLYSVAKTKLSPHFKSINDGPIQMEIRAKNQLFEKTKDPLLKNEIATLEGILSKINLNPEDVLNEKIIEVKKQDKSSTPKALKELYTLLNKYNQHELTGEDWDSINEKKYSPQELNIIEDLKNNRENPNEFISKDNLNKIQIIFKNEFNRLNMKIEKYREELIKGINTPDDVEKQKDIKERESLRLPLFKIEYNIPLTKEEAIIYSEKADKIETVNNDRFRKPHAPGAERSKLHVPRSDPKVPFKQNEFDMNFFNNLIEELKKNLGKQEFFGLSNQQKIDKLIEFANNLKESGTSLFKPEDLGMIANLKINDIDRYQRLVEGLPIDKELKPIFTELKRIYGERAYNLLGDKQKLNLAIKIAENEDFLNALKKVKLDLGEGFANLSNSHRVDLATKFLEDPKEYNRIIEKKYEPVNQPTNLTDNDPKFKFLKMLLEGSIDLKSLEQFDSLPQEQKQGYLDELSKGIDKPINYEEALEVLKSIKQTASHTEYNKYSIPDKINIINKVLEKRK